MLQIFIEAEDHGDAVRQITTLAWMHGIIPADALGQESAPAVEPVDE